VGASTERSLLSPARAFAVVGLGAVVGPLDSAVNIAFPSITAAFGLELASIRWLIICYLLTYSGLIMVSGRLGDLYGYRRVFGIGLALVAAAFLGCAAAPSYAWLLVARVVQGVGIALVLGAGPALALSIHPDSQRTAVLARYAAVFAVGLAIGPLAGGVLVEQFGWRAVFWARAPLALAALALLGRVPAAPVHAPGRAFDALGAALLALGASRESGASIIAEHTRLADDVAAAGLIITGEGRFDDQSLHGKVVSALAAGAAQHGIGVLVLAGQVTLDEPTLRAAGVRAAFAVADYAGSVQLAIDDAANQLEGLARQTAAGWS